MKFLFLTSYHSSLADEDSAILQKVKAALILNYGVEEVEDAEEADAIIIQEKFSFKNFNYMRDLVKDPYVLKYANKVYTINSDDWATGALKGLYTSIPIGRYNSRINCSIPYFGYPNNLIFDEYEDKLPTFLGTWRGNLVSNKVRRRMVNVLDKKNFRLELTTSWLNHEQNEKEQYRDLLLAGKFSLCPAGWAPTTFRIYESMALKRAPVIISDEFIPPTGPHWNSFAIFIPQKNIKNIEEILREYESRSEELGEKANEAWKSFFAPDVIQNYYANALMSLINNQYKTTVDQELKRFRSFTLYWQNEWTLFQRLTNRMKKIFYTFSSFHS